MIYRKDNARWMGLLNLRKLANLWMLWSSYKLSRVTKLPWHAGMPTAISVEPTTACNLGCPECPSGLRSFTRPTGNLKIPTFEALLGELGPYLTYITFYFQGEPFIHPKFLDMVEMAAKRRIYTSTSTNAHFLHPALAESTVKSGLHRLIISIDGTTQEVYEQYRRGGNLNKVLEGTRNMVAAKKKLQSNTPHLVFQFLVVKPNEHQVAEVKALATEMGVDEVHLKTAQFYDYEYGNALMPESDHYRRYRQLKNGRWVIKNKMDNHCWRMWQGCVITWDGQVVPCCFDKDARHTLGSTATESFRKIWKGEPYRQFRKAVLSGRNKIDICTNCTEGTAGIYAG